MMIRISGEPAVRGTGVRRANCPPTGAVPQQAGQPRLGMGQAKVKRGNGGAEVLADAIHEATNGQLCSLPAGGVG